MKLAATVFVTLFAAIYSKLVVFHPNSLRKQINDIDGSIPSSLANFGLVQYGHSIIGRVWFDDNNTDGCGDFNMVIDGRGDPDSDPSPIVLVKRGNCPFTQKVRNVEHAGGRLAIVIDDRKYENVEDIIMVDDGSGNGISIPSMLIGKSDGEKILKAMEDGEGTHQSSTVSLMATFDITNPDNRVEWDFWYTSSNTKAMAFFREYKEWNQKLGDKTLFTPHFSFHSCPDCDKVTKKNDCFGDGLYCAVDENNLGFSGKEILYENLRQKCLHNYLTKAGKADAWWDYVIKAHAICYNDINKDCSKRIHEQLGFDFAKTQECVEDSFITRDHTNSENTLLRDEHEYWKKYGPHFFPAAVVNNVTYRGSLDPQNFFQAVCEGFKNKPEECGVKSINSFEGINTSTLLLIIVGLVVLNAGVIICYKRYTKKEMDEKIEMHINSAVSQYFALQDKNNSKTTRPLVN